MNFLNSLKIKFTAGVFVIVASVIAVHGVVSFIYEKRMLEERVSAQLSSVANLKKELLLDYVTQRKNDLRLMATSNGLRKRVIELVDPLTSPARKREASQFVLQRLRAFKGIHPGYQWLLVHGLEGGASVHSESPPGAPAPLSPEQREVLSFTPRITGHNDAVVLQPGIAKGCIDIARAVRDDGGKPLAVIITRVDLGAEFFPAFTDYSGLGSTGETLLVTRNNGEVLHLNPTRFPAGHGLRDGAEHRRLRYSRHVLSGQDGFGTGFDYRGKEIIGAYRFISELQWGVIAKIDAGEAFAEIDRLLVRRLLLSAVLLAVTLVIVYLVVGNFSSPIAELSLNTRAVGAGRFSPLKQSGRKDEIGELEENFNGMVTALDAARKAADMKHEELEARVRERTETLAQANEALSRALGELRREAEEKKKLQAQLLHAQKLEAVGTLAGGVAHDFNNLLTAITGYTHMLRAKLGKGDPRQEYVDHVLSAAERAAGLTHSLLAFSRKQIVKPRPMNVNDCIARVEKLLARLIGEDIELRIKPCGGDLVILADPGQIEQVLMNLATNARDAMPAGGTFTIATSLAELDERYVALHGYGEVGRYAAVCASDTGQGMDEPTRARIFEPFFTTKEPGKGTGLGLSIVYGIVKAQNGYINCYSEPGKGTTFKIYLPLAREAVQTDYPAGTQAVRGGTETILVAEDNKDARSLIRAVLAENGYTVLEAEDGAEAIERFTRLGGAVDLLVLDIIMPRKNGRDVYEELSRLRPGIKAIFTSGYTDDIIRRQGFLEGGFELIAKPIAPRDLLLKVREALDRRPAATV